MDYWVNEWYVNRNNRKENWKYREERECKESKGYKKREE